MSNSYWSPSVGPRRLLIVEDEPAHALLMATRLHDMGVEVEQVASREEATRKLESRDFDIVILDMGLPDGSGLEVQSWLGTRPKLTPVLFVTSDDLVDHAVAAVRQGAADYVVKRPGYLDRMAEAVLALLAGLPRAADPASARDKHRENQRADLLRALTENDWNVSATSRALGMSRGKLRGRMRTLGLD